MLVGDTKVIHIRNTEEEKNSLKINSSGNVSICILLNWISKREAWLICVLIKYFLVFVDCPIEVRVQTISQVYKAVYNVLFLIHGVSLCQKKIIILVWNFSTVIQKTVGTLKWGWREFLKLLSLKYSLSFIYKPFNKEFVSLK